MNQGALVGQAAGAVAVAALTAAGAADRLPALAPGLVERGASWSGLREAAYLASLFCGFPAGVAALVALAPLGPAGDDGRWCDRPPPTRAEALTRGRELFARIHGETAARQLAMLGQAHPDFAETVLAEAYGRVLARDFLPLAVRELVGVAVLAVRGLHPQLRAHLSAARRAGAGWDEIEAAVREATLLAAAPHEAALAVLEERRRRELAGGGPA